MMNIAPFYPLDRQKLEVEYKNDCVALNSVSRPSASRRAREVMHALLLSYGIEIAPGGYAWTPKSKAMRFSNSPSDLALNSEASSLSPGRRCILYVRLPEAIAALSLKKGDFLGLAGDVSTQSTSVLTHYYFLCTPSSGSTWNIFAYIDATVIPFSPSTDKLFDVVTEAKERSNKVKRKRAYSPCSSKPKGFPSDPSNTSYADAATPLYLPLDTCVGPTGPNDAPFTFIKQEFSSFGTSEAEDAALASKSSETDVNSSNNNNSSFVASPDDPSMLMSTDYSFSFNNMCCSATRMGLEITNCCDDATFLNVDEPFLQDNGILDFHDFPFSCDNDNFSSWAGDNDNSGVLFP